MTYWDPKKERLCLQLKLPDKNYDIEPIHAAAVDGDVEKMVEAWVGAPTPLAFNGLHQWRPPPVFKDLQF